MKLRLHLKPNTGATYLALLKHNLLCIGTHIHFKKANLQTCLVNSKTLHWMSTMEFNGRVQWRVKPSTECPPPLFTWTVECEQWCMISAGSTLVQNYALNRVWPSKKIKFIFLFLIVFYWWRSICRIWSHLCFFLVFNHTIKYRWHDQKIDVFSQVQECRSNK